MDVNAGILVEGVLDGTTIAYQVVVYNDLPLVQRFDEETGNCSPDWASVWEEIKSQGASDARVAKLPRIYIKARDLASGEDLTKSVKISSVTYNEVSTISWAAGTTAFNETIRMNGGNEEYFGIKYGTDETPIPSVMLIGNPADALTNPDNDRISFSGSVVCDGAQVNFQDLGKDIEIIPEVDVNAGYGIVLSVPTNENIDSYIVSKGSYTKRIAQLTYDGEIVEISKTPHFFKYYDITGADDVQLVNESGMVELSSITKDGQVVPNNCIKIYEPKLNSMMSVRCDAYSGTPAEEGRRLASFIALIYDLSDEYQVKFKVADDAAFTSGIEVISNSNLSEGPVMRIHKGETKYIKPQLTKGFGGEDVPGTHTWSFNADDPNTSGGDPEPITDMSDNNINTHATGLTYCFVNFSDVVKSVTEGGVPMRKKRPVKLHARTQL